MKKICVYTCITGEYDNLKELSEKEKGIDYYLFTNNENIKSNTWNVIYLENEEKLNDHLLSRKIKMLGHPIINDKYDIALWMDASIYFNKSIKEFINKYYDESKAKFSAFKHSERNCIYEEMNECLRKRKDTKRNIIKTKKFLEKEKFPKNYGLCEMTVFIRSLKDENVKKTCKMWFDMVSKYSKRDQLSFMYCVWKNNLKLNIIRKNVWKNSWFKANPHNYEKEISSYRVYFGEEKNFDMNKNFSGKMTKKNGLYNITIKVPCKTQKTVIELSRIPFIKLSNLKINNIKNLKIHYFNGIQKDNEVIFYNENGAFEIYNNLKKGQILKIQARLIQASQKDIVTMIVKQQEDLETKNNMLAQENIEIKTENYNMKQQLNEINNSRIWKFTRPLARIFKGRK